MIIYFVVILIKNILNEKLKDILDIKELFILDLN